ncbi:hypothetical protein L3X38_000023 [Prunus dulcis]|uniref:Uncharacterized protein n=1 Tax=Prunus dulcis TaxID=3755 RepID=A0AAD4YJE8_PRUDU|nr:hypothetical protein L3X38_000023 [Prunus dulcis]
MVTKRRRTKLAKFLSKSERFRAFSDRIWLFQGQGWSGKEGGEATVQTRRVSSLVMDGGGAGPGRYTREVAEGDECLEELGKIGSGSGEGKVRTVLCGVQ